MTLQFATPVIVCVLNIKGGVGKSTSTATLAACALEAGAAVTCVDLDAQQRDLLMFRDALPGARFTDRLPTEYTGLTLIDCAPFLDRTTAPALKAATLVLVPTQASAFSFKGVEQMARAVPVAAPQAHFKAFVTMYSSRHRDARTEIQTALNGQLLNTTIPMSGHVERASDNLTTVIGAAPSSMAAKAYKRLWSEIYGLHR